MTKKATRKKSRTKKPTTEKKNPEKIASTIDEDNCRLDDISEDIPQIEKLMEKRAIRERANSFKEQQNDDAEDSFYINVVFQSAAQRNEFLDQLKKACPDMIVLWNKYLDGEAFAQYVGHPVTESEMPYKNYPISQKMQEMTLRYAD